ncbi:MAG: hypothetical protein AAGJ46_01040 [Planctomycetota bacterium]
MTKLLPPQSFAASDDHPGLQPVYLPTDAWRQFSIELSEALSELESNNRPVRQTQREAAFEPCR